MGGRLSRSRKQSLEICIDDSSDSGEEVPRIVDSTKADSYNSGKGKLARKKKQEGNLLKYHKPRVKDAVGKGSLPRSTTPIKGDMDSLKMKTLEIFSKIPSYELYGTEEKLIETKNDFSNKIHIKKNTKSDHDNTQKINSHKNQHNHFKKCVKSYAKSHSAAISFFTQLDFEMNELVLSSYQIIEKLASACEFIRLHIQTTTQKIFNGILKIKLDKNITIVLYGSMATGFAYDNSDLDFSLFGLRPLNRESLDQQIDLLSKELSTDPLVTECKAIPSALVPIIKLVFSILLLRKFYLTNHAFKD